MKLGETLSLGSGEIVALTGAGGKTSALYAMAREAIAQGRRVLLTTTTHMRPPQEDAWPLVLAADPGTRAREAADKLAQRGRVFVAAAATEEGRLAGVPPAEVKELAALADLVLVEADGARGLWLKAPAPHEPVIPRSATLVVPVVGLQAIGLPLDATIAHRPERVAALLGITQGEPVTVDHVARLLLHPQGALRGVPPAARVVPLCNQADSPERREAGRRVAAAVLHKQSVVTRVVVGAARTASDSCERWEPSTAVVLAAGASRRYGALKQALEWEGRPLLARVAAAALSSLASSVHVVLGCRAGELEPLLAAQRSPRLHMVVNSAWAGGLAGSVRAGLESVPPGVQAVVFCHADQPLLAPETIDALLARRAATGADIVAPRYQGELRSPVLFGRALFAELLALEGDVGGRGLLARYRDRLETIDVDDALPYEDIDTPADYERLRRTLDEKGRDDSTA